jgi:hypothetical protein
MSRSGCGLLLLVAMGCGREGPPPGPPGLRDVNGAVVETKPGKSAETASAPSTSGIATPQPAFEPPPLPTLNENSKELSAVPSAKPTATPDADASAAQPERDLSAELAALLNPHGTCLDLAAAAKAGGTLHLSASAMVLPGGSISRATVSSPGQPGPALACIENRLRGARLAPPIPGAPRSVSASITLEVAMAPAAAPTLGTSP